MLGFPKRYFELRYQDRIQTLKRGAEAFRKKYFSPQPPQECRLYTATVNLSRGKEHVVSFQEKQMGIVHPLILMGTFNRL